MLFLFVDSVNQNNNFPAYICARGVRNESEIELRLEGPPCSAAHVEIGIIIKLLPVNISPNGKVNSSFAASRICRLLRFAVLNLHVVLMSYNYPLIKSRATFKE